MYVYNNKLDTLLYIQQEMNKKIFLENNQLLGKYQHVTNYKNLVDVNDIYKLDNDLINNLHVNNSKSNKVNILKYFLTKTKV